MWKRSWDSILCFREHLSFLRVLPALQELVLLRSSSRAHFGWKEIGNPAVEHPLTLREVPRIYLELNTLEESRASGWVNADPLCDSHFLLGELKSPRDP